MHKLYALILFVITITATAQSHIEFVERRVDCGVVKWKQPVTATFILTNNATRTATISQVRPDCSCTAVSWTYTPIAPGGQAQVQVTYDAEQLGTFEKQVAVYTNLSSKPTYATMRGRVVMRLEAFASEINEQPKHNVEDFNHTIGDIHVSNANIEFDNVQQGDSPTVTLHILNTGETPYAPQVMHLPQWLTAAATPAIVRPGHTGDIVFRLRSAQMSDYGLTQRSVYLSRFPGDVVGQDNELTVSATILPKLPTDVSGPVPAIACDTIIELGSFNGKEQLKATVNIHNNGSAALQIGKLQVYNLGIFASLSSTRIRNGGKAKLTITATPAIFDHHGRHRILLITNDPKRPKVQIEVRATK